jgi:hypothetical protein
MNLNNIISKALTSDTDVIIDQKLINNNTTIEQANIDLEIIDEINLSEVFFEKYIKYLEKHKYNNGNIKKYTAQIRFLNFFKFINNNCYWSRFNLNPITNKYETDSNSISGKYLHELFSFMVKFDFFLQLYSHLLGIYLKVTNYKTLANISIDSCFIRNMYGLNATKNPKNANKPGYKVHTLVDSNRVPISIIITNSNVHDSTAIKLLFKNLIIDKSIFNKYCNTFLADSAYSNLVSIEFLTSIGLKILMSRNKQYTKNVPTIHIATIEELTLYKKRLIVENFFCNLLKVPCLCNFYEHKISSYQNLLLFYLCINITKKINDIIRKNNDINYRKQKEDERKIIQEKEKIRLQKKKEEKILKEKATKMAQVRRKQENDERLNKIKNKIFRYINHNILKTTYDVAYKKHQNLIKTNNTKKGKSKNLKGRPKNLNFEKYEKQFKIHICNHILHDKLTKTIKRELENKTLYFISANKNAFTTRNIRNKVLKFDINEIIGKFTESFFGFDQFNNLII